MITYDPKSTLRAARAGYFDVNRFGSDGGYDKTWVPITIGPLVFEIPNSAGRVRALRFHDLHHIVTGYATTLEGEALIGAWEIASGCSDHYAAWFLNANSFAFGMLLAPRALWHSFVRGRRSKNLYRRSFDEALLEVTVGDLRKELLDDPAAAHARTSDAVAFAGWLALGAWLLLANLAGAPVLVVASAIHTLRKRTRKPV